MQHERPTRLAHVPGEPLPVHVFAPDPLRVELGIAGLTYRRHNAIVATFDDTVTRAVWPEYFTAVV